MRWLLRPSRLVILALTRIFNERFSCNRGFAALAREALFVNCERDKQDKQDMRDRRDARRLNFRSVPLVSQVSRE
jgi:hypothetical protein